MSYLTLATRQGRLLFAPGDAIEGTASWSLDGDPREVEVRLFWFTRGLDEEDVGVVGRHRFEAPGREERREFRLVVPRQGPLSFTGQVVALSWALELVAEPGENTQRLDLLVSSTGREVRLGKLDPQP